MSEQTNLINVVNDEQYVDWPSLRYYDQRIKDYIRTTSATKEEQDQLRQDLEQLEKLLSTFAETFTADKNHILKHIEECKESSATKTELAAALEAIREEIKAISGVDMSAYATKEFVEEKIAEVDIELPEGLVTEDALQEYVVEEIAKIEHPTVDLSGLATKEALAAVDAKIPSVEGLASEEFVIKKIAEAELADQDVDLSAYYTKSETDSAIKSAVDAIEVPDVSNLATKEELDAVQNVAGENSVKLFQVDSDLVDINAKLDTIPTKVSELENDSGYLTEHQDLSGYAKKSDIPEAELFVVDFNAPDFSAALEAYNNGKLLLLVNAAPDVNGYAVMNYVRADLITFTKFLTSRSEAYGSFNTYYLHSDNTWEISKEVKLNKVEANVGGEVNGELTSIRIGKEAYSLPSTEGLASIEYVNTTSQNLQTSITSITETTETLQTTVTQVQENVTQVSTQVTELEQNVQNNYITIENGVTRENLEEAVKTQVETEIDVLVDEKIAEVVEQGVTVSSIAYGEF